MDRLQGAEDIGIWSPVCPCTLDQVLAWIAAKCQIGKDNVVGFVSLLGLVRSVPSFHDAAFLLYNIPYLDPISLPLVNNKLKS